MQSKLSSRLVLLTAALGLMTSQAQAQTPNTKTKTQDAATSKSGKRKALANEARPKTKNYDFLADDIDGSRIRPDNTTIFGRPDARHSSLIRFRTDFIAEILKSADVL